MEGEVGENHPGQTWLETAEAKAERIIAEELGWLRTPILKSVAFLLRSSAASGAFFRVVRGRPNLGFVVKSRLSPVPFPRLPRLPR